MSHVLGLPKRDCGFLLLDLLAVDGWTVTVVAAPIGVRVSARDRDHVIHVEARDVADAGLLLFEAAQRVRRSQRLAA